jgi:hypothetical protein
MVSLLWRSLKRVAVLVPGIIIAYISVRDILPYFDRRLPIGIAIVVTYALAAYLLIPATLRIWRLFVPAKHLPLYCITPDGFASDPLNIGLIGSRRQLIEAMTTAGWHVAEPYTLRNATYEVISTILKKPYHGEPITALYLFGRKQDIGFEIQLIEQGRGHRHHVRFWATTFQDIDNLSQETINWRDRKQEAVGKNLLWLGAASRDAGIALIKHSIQLSHMIHEDTNAERKFIIDGLAERSLAESITTLTLSKPYRLANRSWRLRSGYLNTDGKLLILRLKRQAVRKS